MRHPGHDQIAFADRRLWSFVVQARGTHLRLVGCGKLSLSQMEQRDSDVSSETAGGRERARIRREHAEEGICPEEGHCNRGQPAPAQTCLAGWPSQARV